MRHIPATMATQHPDNALPPYWDTEDRSFVSVHEEIQEAVQCFKDLGVSEYMWDWEGKHADAAVIDRLFSDYFEYFSKNQLGRDKFLTFRIPNIWEEKGYNLLQAMTVVLSSEDFARDLKFHGRPLFEVILPMTERANQLIHVQKLFERLAKFKSKEFTPELPADESYLEIIPLVESVESQLHVDELLREYVKLHDSHFGHKPAYIRAFLACSDSSLSSGFLAGLLGNKLALARLYEFSESSNIPIYPIAGPGGLRFRGGLAPHTIDRFIQELPGVRTVTVQSAFRYDYPKTVVKAAVKELEQKLPKAKPLHFTKTQQKQLVAIAELSAKFYKQTLHELTADMQTIFKAVPKRRDRRQHIGLLGYARSVGGQTLPRAITFTSGFYSLGVPPEFIGLGRTLQALKPAELKQLREAYPNLANDVLAAGKYLNSENLAVLATKHRAWRQVQEDVDAVAEILDLQFGPHAKHEIAHHKLAAAVLTLKDNTAILSDLINRMAALRKSLG
jgi:phosphoenolpyruvate carboxylase